MKYLVLVLLITGCSFFGADDGPDDGNGSADALPKSIQGSYSVSPYTIGNCHGGVLIIRVKENSQCEFSWHNISCSPSYNGSECSMDLNSRTIGLKGSFGYQESFRYKFTEDSLVLNDEITLKKDQASEGSSSF